MRLRLVKQWLICRSVIALVSVHKGCYTQVLGLKWSLLALLDLLQLILFILVDLSGYASPSLGLGAIIFSLQEFFEILGSGIGLQRPQDIIELIIFVVDTGLILNANITFEICIVLIH